MIVACIVTCANSVIAGRANMDAVIVVACIVTCNSVIAGRANEDAVTDVVVMQTDVVDSIVIFNGVIVAIIFEVYTTLFIITDSVACNGIIAGRIERDALVVIQACRVVGYGVVVGISEVDTAVVIQACCVAGYAVVVGISEVDAHVTIAINNIVSNSVIGG